MLKTFAFASASLFCSAAAAFNFWAATLVRHDVPQWEIVQAGVLFVGMAYAVAGIWFLDVAGRRANRKA